MPDPGIVRATIGTGPTRPMKLILYFADGFGWQLLEERPFALDEWTATRPLQSILGYSSTIIPCLLTGRYPRETGVFTEYFLQPRPQTGLEKVLSRTPIVRTVTDMCRLVLFRIARRRNQPQAHRLRISIRFAHLFERQPLDYRQFPPIDLDVPTLADLFRDLGLRVEVRYLSKGPSPAELEHLRAVAPERDVLLYFDASVDTHGHHVGPSTRHLEPELANIETFLREAWREIDALDGEAELVLFSDHGISAVRDSYDILHALRAFKIGTDYLAFLDSTMARFWFPKPEFREPVLAALAEAPGRLLSAPDRAWAGIDFPDDRFGEEILVANEGVVFHPSYISPSFFRTRFPDRGTHGYWPTGASTYGVFGYRGSRLAGSAIPDPVPAVSVFSLVSRILTADAGSDGTTAAIT